MKKECLLTCDVICDCELLPFKADFENAEEEVVFKAKFDFSGDLLRRSFVSGGGKNLLDKFQRVTTSVER